MVVLENVTLSAGRRPVLVGLGCAVKRGTATVITGTAGAGKSLVLAGIMGLVPATQGRITVDGIDVQPFATVVRQRLCHVPVGAPLLPFLSAIEQVQYFAALSGRRVRRRDATTALRLSEVPDRLMHLHTQALGTFERLCVWLAGHRLRETVLLLMDDPSRELTSRQATSLARLIRESLSPDKSIIVTSRDPEFGRQFSDQMLRLDRENWIMISQQTSALSGISSTTPE